MAKSCTMISILFLVYCVTYVVCSKDVDVLALRNSMTAEEKCGHMTQVTFDVVQRNLSTIKPGENPIDMDKLRVALKDYHVGSILNTPMGQAQTARVWQEVLRSVQDVALNETRLRIPVLYGLDSIHGANYIQEGVLFPQPLSLGATFNVDLVEKIGAITALETRAIGIPWNFNPVLDVGRQHAWPRLYETFGEDVHVANTFGVAYVKGSQGDDIKNRTKVASCLKHYIGYSLPFSGHDRTVAWIPENLLRETFLPPFAHAIRAGSPTVMINSGDVNGLPGHANYRYLTDILKGELNFTGFTVSDWEDVKRLHERDKIAETPEEAVRLAVMSGVDMSMVPMDFSFYNHCVNISRKDENFRIRVDDAVLRILQVKKDLGLFEQSYPRPEDLAQIGRVDSEELNLAAARESLVLAKNNGILPMSDPTKRILVTGATANLVKALNGGWSYTWLGDREDLFLTFGRKKYTIVEALQNRTNPVVYFEGANFDNVTNLNETIEAAQSQADLIVLCVGEPTYTETPGNIDDMYLSDSQVELANAVLALNKPVVLVYVGGRPRIITKLAEKADAVVIGFLPGNQGAIAIADLLYGVFNPSGKMPISYPRGPNALLTYDYKAMEAYSYTVGMDASNGYNPLYKFGHGLSYTTYEYSDLALDMGVIHTDQSVSGSVTVRNSGSRDGQETVIVYLQDEYASVSRPNKQVKFFTKVALKANETRTVRFTLTPYDMSLIDKDNTRVVEPGRFFVYVHNLNTTFTLTASTPESSSTTPYVPSTSTSRASSTTTKSSANSLMIGNSQFSFLVVLAILYNFFF